MLDSLIATATQGVESGAAASHTPQTAIAAILCAVLINFFS